MGRYMTPRGVVVETSEEAARAVGYKPAAEKKSESSEKKAPAKKAASPKKKSD